MLAIRNEQKCLKHFARNLQSKSKPWKATKFKTSHIPVNSCLSLSMFNYLSYYLYYHKIRALLTGDVAGN